MEKLGEEEFVGVFDFLCDFSWEGEEKDDESYKMVERGRVRWTFGVLRKNKRE